METVPKNVMINLALKLNFKDIKSLCLTSTRFNEIICESKIFWRKKLIKEYPNIDISNVSEFKKLYFYLNEKIEDVNVKVKEGQFFIDDIEMEKYGKYFTEYPIEYFSNYTNKFVISSKVIRQINLEKDFTTFSGKFGEIYKVKINKKDDGTLMYKLFIERVRPRNTVVTYENDVIIIEI
jgi:hypothetical protein